MSDTTAPITAAEVDTHLDWLAGRLRIAAAVGGCEIDLTPEHCIRLARRIELGGRPPEQPIIVRIAPDADQHGWWLRLTACGLLGLAASDAALSIARWISAL